MSVLLERLTSITERTGSSADLGAVGAVRQTLSVVRVFETAGHCHVNFARQKLAQDMVGDVGFLPLHGVDKIEAAY